ncbi:hypothetical protein Tco_0944649, partial [Tanacetum coccineum]
MHHRIRAVLGQNVLSLASLLIECASRPYSNADKHIKVRSMLLSSPLYRYTFPDLTFAWVKGIRLGSVLGLLYQYILYHEPGIQKALTKEVKEMSDAFDELEAELDQSTVDRKHDEIERKNLLIEHDNIIADGLSKEPVVWNLKQSFSILRNNIRKDNYNELLNRFSNLEVKPKVLAPEKYAIDVEPIPPRNRNNREVHLVYLRHLKESVDTLREIVEEAKVERPLDRSLAFACHYSKYSQELLEYVFGTCLKVFNQQDKKHAHTPRKKQVSFEDQIATSSSTTHKHVEPMYTQQSNVHVPPFTGVNNCTNASGSQPRSILKKHTIPPAKSDNMKKVEERPRTIRSSLKTTNRVDSSISSKRI